MTLIDRIWFRFCLFPLILLFIIIHGCFSLWVITKTAWQFNKVNHFFDVSCLTISGGQESIRVISQNLDKIQKEFVATRIRRTNQ